MGIPATAIPAAHLIPFFPVPSGGGRAAGLELISDAMYYRFGHIFGQWVRPRLVLAQPYLTRH